MTSSNTNNTINSINSMISSISSDSRNNSNETIYTYDLNDGVGEQEFLLTKTIYIPLLNGNGTLESPYEIWTIDDLKLISSQSDNQETMFLKYAIVSLRPSSKLT